MYRPRYFHPRRRCHILIRSGICCCRGSSRFFLIDDDIMFLKNQVCDNACNAVGRFMVFLFNNHDTNSFDDDFERYFHLLNGIFADYFLFFFFFFSFLFLHVRLFGQFLLHRRCRRRRRRRRFHEKSPVRYRIMVNFRHLISITQ